MQGGPLLLLIAYLLLAPPVFLFGPLAGLLLLSRPRTAREWLWIVATGTWSVLWLNQAGDLAGQFARAGAVLLTGTYLALSVWRPSATFSRVLASTGVASFALMLWMSQFDVGLGEVQRAVQQDLWTYNRALVMRLQYAVPDSGAESLIGEMSSMVRTVGALYPALLALAGLGGLRLAWAWHHRIALQPVGPPQPRFAEFEFSDQLVWGWVVGLACCLLPLPPVWRILGANLLLVWAVLYATRGLAVFSAGSRRVPMPIMATVTLVAMFLLPFVVGGLTLLGLADTWLNFRRRLTASATGG